MALTDQSASRPCRQNTRFAFHYDSWVHNLMLLLPGAREHSIEVSNHEVRARIGSGGEIRIPRDSIVRVWRTSVVEQGVLSWLPPRLGARTNLRGVWWLNCSKDNLVAVDIEPPATGRVWGITIHPRRIVISLEEPAKFVDEVLG